MKKDVAVYTTPTCPYCKMVKDYLDGRGIEYEEFDVSTDRSRTEEMVEMTGQLGVPVVKIGDKHVVGFDKGQLESMLEDRSLFHDAEEANYLDRYKNEN